MYVIVADGVNILGGSVHTVKENAEVLVVATKKIGLEISADESKHMVMSREQNAGRSHSMKIDNSSTERLEEFIFGNDVNRSKVYSRRSKEQVRECVLSFGSEFFVFQFATQKLKYQDI
jgi:hypothetical protein